MARPTMPAVVHVEGMDLAGKSTITSYLSESTNRSIQRNSLVPNNPIYERADELRRNGASAGVLGTMYTDALRWDLDHLDDVGPRVQDSTILLRSLAFNEVIGQVEIVQAMKAMIPKHPVFGLTVVLTATIEARLGRLAERQRLAPEEVAPDDLMVITKPELFLAMEAALLDYAATFFNAVVIDTSTMTKTDVRAAMNEVLTGTRVHDSVFV